MGVDRTDTVAEALHRLTFQGLDGATLDKAKVVLLDGLAVALVGLHADVSRIAREAAGHTPQGDCTIWGTDRRSAPMEAVLANSVPIHCYLHDDMIPGSNTHPQSMLLPLVMALGEAQHLSGPRVLLALVRGYEAVGILGPKPLADAIGQRGFKAGSVLGTLGSAATSASLMNLDARQTANALACAASFTSGLRQVVRHAGMERCFQNAAAARGGLLAARLAQQNLEADRAIFHDAAGFAPTLGGISQPQTPAANEQPFILHATHRHYPGVGIIGASTAAAEQLVTRHPLDTGEISQIRVWATPERAARPETRVPGPFISMEQALLSRPLAIAAVLHHGTLTPAIYEASRGDREVLDLAAKVQIMGQEDLGPEEARLEVTLSNGQHIEHQGGLDPATVYLTLPAAVAKFHRLVGGILEEERAAQVVDLVAGAETLDDVSGLARLLAA